MKDCTREVHSRVSSENTLSFPPSRPSFLQTRFPVTDGEIKVLGNKAGVVSHMDVSLHAFGSKLSTLGWTQEAETQQTWQLAADSRADPVPLPGLLLLLQSLRGYSWGVQGSGGCPEPGPRLSAQHFCFISLRGLGRNNVIASPLGNTAFLCHGNVYPVQTGEFWLWGRSETCSRNDLVKKKGRRAWKKQRLQL